MNKNITFKALKEEHFLLLLKWLETPHVKKWWDADINWTPELIEKKYSTYIKGFKRLKFETQIIKKPMHAFIINCDGVDIGYIQYYNKHDFPPEQGYDTSELSESCAAIDWYIGELDYVGKGIGPQALNIFLNEFVFKVYENAFVDPDIANVCAIRVYEKVGFKKIMEINSAILMIKARIPENHSR
ncbi:MULTISPECIES: acetyltransferase [unclassified Wolbachia]|uniref:acetyltransferase n=1 Tax=unclassified Wolbachia TaxID=2640676 RepID=UPI0021F85072|nr:MULTISPECIES: acetyltransferase [unclassified Wolbachia]